MTAAVDPWDAPAPRPVDSEETYRTDSAWLLRCRGCSAARKVTVTTETVHGARNGFGFSRSSYVRPDGLLRAYADALGLRRLVAAYAAPCACGQTRWAASRVEGRLRPDKRCDARCRNAVGPVCECQCAGEHHGDTWAA